MNFMITLVIIEELHGKIEIKHKIKILIRDNIIYMIKSFNLVQLFKI